MRIARRAWIGAAAAVLALTWASGVRAGIVVAWDTTGVDGAAAFVGATN
jgi:hypothetical protein